LLPESFQTHLKRVIGNSQGGGGPKAKILKGKYEPKLKFLEGRSNQTTLPPFNGRGMDVFWNNTSTKCMNMKSHKMNYAMNFSHPR